MSPNSVASGAHCVKVVEDVVVKMFTFAVSSLDEFLVVTATVEQIQSIREGNTCDSI